MLVDIYARSMMHATRHSDLPQRPLPEPYALPPRRPGKLRQMISAFLRLLGRVVLHSTTAQPPHPRISTPTPCK